MMLVIFLTLLPFAVAENRSLRGLATTSPAVRMQASPSGTIRMASDPNKCISASAGWSHNGNNVQIWDCGSGSAFEFTMPASGTGFIRMASDPNKCISASAGWSHNGNNLQIWDCGSGSAFEFIVPTPTPTPAPSTTLTATTLTSTTLTPCVHPTPAPTPAITPVFVDMYDNKACSGSPVKTVELSSSGEARCDKCWDRCAEGDGGYPAYKLRGPGTAVVAWNCIGKWDYESANFRRGGSFTEQGGCHAPGGGGTVVLCTGNVTARLHGEFTEYCH